LKNKRISRNLIGESMSTHSESNAKSPLDAALKIVAELAGMNPEHQALAIKFATETLGLQPPTATEVPAISSQSAASPMSSGADHSADIRTFTAMKAPKSDQQFTAVVAYFYQFEAKPEERTETIDADTMKEAARLAGRAQVARWNMTLTNAKNAGYLDAAGAGKFKLSSVGENLVAITLPGNEAPKGGKRSISTKTSKKTTSKKTASKKQR
jgi:hypothetical protein